MTIATPLAGLPTQPLETLPLRIATALRGAGVDLAGLAGLAVGLPVEKSGREGEAAVWVRSCAEACLAALAGDSCPAGLRLEFVDERFTTRASEQLGKELGFDRKQRSRLSDAWAATSILQSWIDRSS